MRCRICWITLLCVSANAQAQTFPDRPLRIIVAFSTGTAADIVARQIALKLTDSLGKQVIIEVAYRTTAQALNDTISGEVAMYFPNLASALPSIRSGRLKGLAVTGVQRSQAAPEIPALAETLSGYEAASWYGIVVPARTPQAVIARLHTDIAKALQQSDVRQRFLSLSGDIVSGGPEDLGKTMRGGTEKWGKLVKEIDARGR